MQALYNEIKEMVSRVSVQNLTPPSPQTNYSVNTQQQKVNEFLQSYDVLKMKILATSTASEIEDVMKEVKNSTLLWKEKQNLEVIAKQHSINFYTD